MLFSKLKMPYGGGTVCIYRPCPSKTRDKNVSMFRIPRDSKRAQQWLKRAGRSDLLFKTNEELNKNYKLCELHFEQKWFTSHPKDDRRRLLNEAVPTLFALSDPEQLQVALDDEHEDELPRKVTVLPDIKVVPAIDLAAKEDALCSTASGSNAAKQLLSPVPGQSGTTHILNNATVQD